MADEVWVVSASHASVISRLAERNGLSATEAEARIAKQMSPAERLARCHVPLSSACGEAEMRAQLEVALVGARRRATRTLESQPADTPAGTFAALCDSLGASAAASRRWWSTLRDAYCDSRRWYHNMDHIVAMLARVTQPSGDGTRSVDGNPARLSLHCPPACLDDS